MINEPMAVYRFGVGVWSKEEQFTRSLRTARTHLILASYFSEIGNEAITRIFLNRVVRFLSANSAAISTENFSYLLDNYSCSNELMVALIRLLDSNNMKVKDLNQNQVQHTSSWSLMRTVVNRAIKKLPGFN